MKLIINPEFRDLIPPLTPAELDQLQRGLDADGCLSPLLVWKGKGILVDGHNRYKHCKANNIPFDVKEVTFYSEQAAKNFIILNQLGRRNLSPEAAALLRGQLYTARKKTDSERVSESNKSRSGGGQNDLHREPETGKIVGGNNCPQQKTADMIAKETGVSPATVKRDAKFAAAADKLGVTKDIIAGNEKRSRREIVEAAFPKALPKQSEKPPAEPEQPKQSGKWKPVVDAFQKLPYNDMKKAIEKITEIWNNQ